jgi:transcriptional regulator with XRE-family HTH domain
MTVNAEEMAGKRLRELRNARGWPLREVAEQMRAFGYTWHQTVVAKIETGQRPIRLSEAIDLARLFGVTLEDLVPPSGDATDTRRRIALAEQALTVTQMQYSQARAALDKAEAECAALAEQEREAKQQVILFEGTLFTLRRSLKEAGS